MISVYKINYQSKWYNIIYNKNQKDSIMMTLGVMIHTNKIRQTLIIILINFMVGGENGYYRTLL